MPRRNGTGIALLADPTRRQILAMVAERPRRPGAVARAMGVSRSTATRQLRLLQEGGLVTRRRSAMDGRAVVYFLEPRRVGAIIAWLAGTEVAVPDLASADWRPS